MQRTAGCEHNVRNRALLALRRAWRRSESEGPRGSLRLRARRKPTLRFEAASENRSAMAWIAPVFP
jgi:hypothetical protein